MRDLPTLASFLSENIDPRWRGGESPSVDEIGKFWVIMKPTPESEMSDILFDTTLFGFVIQVQGGLKQDEIHGIYRDSAKARSTAERLLSQRRKRT